MVVISLPRAVLSSVLHMMRIYALQNIVLAQSKTNFVKLSRN